MTVQELLSAAQQLSLSDQVRLASELMQTAIQTIQKSSDTPPPLDFAEDPLIGGLFSGSPDLATRSEDILAAESRPQSGFTWKES